MKKIARKIATGIAAATASMSIFATKVAAQYDYDWDYSYGTTASDTAGGLFGLGFSMVCWAVMCILWLATAVFVVMMILDVLKRDEKVLPKKTLWLVLMIAGVLVGGWGFFVALIYFFTRKKKMDAMTKAAPQAPASPAA